MTAQQKKIEAPKEAAGSSLAKTMLVEGPAYLVKANALKVTNEAEHKEAITLLTQIAAKTKAAQEERLKITRPMDVAKTAVMSFFQALTDPFTTVDTLVRKKVKVYEDAEKAKAAAAQKILDDKAAAERKRIADQAVEEKRKADAKVEEQRQIAQQKAADAAALLAKADDAEDPAEAKRLADQAKVLTSESVKADRKAETIETKAIEKVDVLESRAMSVVAATVQAPALKATGRISRKVWKWKVIDASKFARAVLIHDETKINGLVKALHKEAGAIIGEGAVEIWDEDDIGIRGAK